MHRLTLAAAPAILALTLACGPTHSGDADAGTGQPVCKNDGIKNGTESDIDCGGGCIVCGPGRTCTADSDCFSNSCKLGLCQNPTPTCNDTRLNGNESDIDCGGDKCEGCAPGKKCGTSADCQSKVCTGGTCAAPTCFDGVKNAVETDVDCGGGSMCSPCANGKGCAAATDCASGVCTGGVCLAPTCMDGVKNGDETDVDCGGSCGPTCANGKQCALATDCVDSICAGGTCAPGSCTDFVKNHGETDVDCGGPNCAKCQTFKSCQLAGDCLDGVCFQQQCQPPSCSDAVKNGGETDVDCGGTTCPSCADFKKCNVGTDCQSQVCGNGTCSKPTCFDGVRNGSEPDIDCGQPCSQKCSWGKQCFTGSDCIATVDCSGGTCSACAFGQSDCDFSTADGCESNTSSDLFNCGGCGISCSNTNATASCVSSSCMAACNPGFGDCDFDPGSNGCETNLKTDPQNCGACGVSTDDNNPCTTDSCVNGAAQHTPVNVNDNDLCTTDSCDPTNGVTHTPISCDDNNPLTCDSCAPSTGVCSHAPVLASWDFSSPTGWTLGTGWQIGSATASSGGSFTEADPANDHTPTSDNMELGTYIGGNIPVATMSSMSYAVSPVTNLSGVSGNVSLDLWRVLISDYPPYMNSTIDVYNGTTWINVFNVPGSPGIQDAAWTHMQIDVTPYKNANFQIRIGYQITSTSAYTIGGWNIDDVRLLPSGSSCQ